MHDRLRALRKSLNKTLMGVAHDLKMSDAYFSQLETGKLQINDRIVQLICLTYNVNEQWLRTGEGEMFNPPKLLDVSPFEYAKGVGCSDLFASIFADYCSLDEPDKVKFNDALDVVMGLIKSAQCR